MSVINWDDVVEADLLRAALLLDFKGHKSVYNWRDKGKIRTRIDDENHTVFIIPRQLIKKPQYLGADELQPDTTPIATSVQPAAMPVQNNDNPLLQEKDNRIADLQAQIANLQDQIKQFNEIVAQLTKSQEENISLLKTTFMLGGKTGVTPIDLIPTYATQKKGLFERLKDAIKNQ